MCCKQLRQEVLSQDEYEEVVLDKFGEPQLFMFLSLEQHAEAKLLLLLATFVALRSKSGADGLRT